MLLDQIFPPDRTPFFLYMLYPPFAFYRILFYCPNSCISMRCYGIDVFSAHNGLNLVTTAMLYLGVSTIVLFIISEVLPYTPLKGNGVVQQIIATGRAMFPHKSHTDK